MESTIQTALKSFQKEKSTPVTFELEQYADVELSADQEMEALTSAQVSKWLGMPIESRPETPDSVLLEDTEQQEAFRQARKAIHFAIKRIEYSSAIAEPTNYVTATAEELFTEFQSQFEMQSKEYEVNIKNLCCYFSRDARFRGDLDKGLLLIGSVGTGKTTVMKIFGQNQNHSFRVVSMLDVAFDYKMKGEEGVNRYASNFNKYPNVYGQANYGYCFDDVGVEEIPARHFGESKNILSEIIQVRYNNRHMVPFNSTHITTNKELKEIEELYGSRAYDRMREMFNVMTFNNGSFRAR